VFLLLICSFGCAPSPQQSDQGSDLPQLTDSIINEQINYTRVTDIPEEDGKAGPISWRFAEDEPRELRIVEKNVEGPHATVVLDIKTTSSPRSPIHRTLAGRIRTEWQLRSGWVLRKWEIIDAENISMKYKDFPKPLPSNSNR
jgi:hypothetical protein